MPVEHTQHHAASRHFLLRQLHARPRLFSAVALAALIYGLLPFLIAMHPTTHLLIAWNTGIGMYLLLAGGMVLTRASHEHMRARARMEDEGRLAVMSCAILATIACLVAIFFDLSHAKNLQGSLRYLHVALAILTVALSWLFIHLMFALNYAHDFYTHTNGQRNGGLEFPNTAEPDYLDFLYFSCIIGTSGQTADVSISSQALRRTSLVHCILSYAFNTTVLALAINLAAGLM
ncbi:MAG: DUF1345 domain-containing protein [Pseudomonadales bacterium]|jgi:uncharacterized membrane protein|nr:DUF1345 domain-containing protein [Pseudomonadales bacterium]